MAIPHRLFLVLTIVLTCLSGRAQSPAVYSFQQDDTLLRRKLFQAAEARNKNTIAALGKDNLKDYKQAYESQLEMVRDLLGPLAGKRMVAVTMEVPLLNKPEAKAAGIRGERWYTDDTYFARLLGQKERTA